MELNLLETLLTTITQTFRFLNDRDEKRLSRDVRKLQKEIRREKAKPYHDLDHRYLDSLRLELKGILKDFGSSVERSDIIPEPRKGELDLQSMFEGLDEWEKMQEIGKEGIRPNEPTSETESD